MFGGLQLRSIGWLVDELDAIGNGQVFGGMPSGIVELEDDATVARRADLSGKGFKQFGEEGFADAVGDEPDGLPTCWRDEGRDVEPFVAMMAERQRALAERRPDATADRLQAD
jgi:hypothetical protein